MSWVRCCFQAVQRNGRTDVAFPFYFVKFRALCVFVVNPGRQKDAAFVWILP